MTRFYQQIDVRFFMSPKEVLRSFQSERKTPGRGVADFGLLEQKSSATASANVAATLLNVTNASGYLSADGLFFKQTQHFLAG